MLQKVANANYELGRFPLGGDERYPRYVVVCKFNGMTYFHIRQYERKGEREYPTKVGTCMTPKRFAMFLLTVPKIEEAKKEIDGESESVDVKEHIGGGVYIAAKSGKDIINIRKHFMPSGSAAPVPTRMGIGLRFPEWDKLMECIENMKNPSPDLANAEPCFNGNDHANLMGFLQCPECCPHEIDLQY